MGVRRATPPAGQDGWEGGQERTIVFRSARSAGCFNQFAAPDRQPRASAGPRWPSCTARYQPSRHCSPFTLSRRRQLSEEEAGWIDREIKILTHLGAHDNICQLLDAVDTPGAFFLILEYCDGGGALVLIPRVIHFFFFLFDYVVSGSFDWLPAVVVAAAAAAAAAAVVVVF